MDFRGVEDVISESMVLTDHPSEPMLVRIWIETDPSAFQVLLSTESRFAFIRNLFEIYPECASFFMLSEKKTVLVVPSRVDEAYEMSRVVWSLQEKNESEFFKSHISPFRAPLFRLRYTEGGDFCLSIHHALMDGHSGHDFTWFLLERVIEFQEFGTLRRLGLNLKSHHAESKSKFFYAAERMRRILKSFGSIRKKLKQPPVLLGEKTALSAEGQDFFKLKISNHELKAALRNVRSKIADVTVNELLAAALHLSLESELRRQKESGSVFAGDQYISTMIPVDLRSRKSDSTSVPLISNLSTTPSLVTLSSERQDRWQLLTLIHQQSKNLHESTADSTIGALELLSALGVFKSAREVKMRTGLPRRVEVGGDSFWKFMDTAMITFTGRTKPSLSLRRFVKSSCGYPPVIPPWGLSITAVSNEKDLTFGVTYSKTTLSRERAVVIVDDFIQELNKYAQ